METVALKIPLTTIERAGLRAQNEAAPYGHFVIGPTAAPPFWVCAVCGVKWANGDHPDPLMVRLSAINERERQETEAIEGEPVPWWIDA
jgi:hypothetical protein